MKIRLLVRALVALILSCPAAIGPAVAQRYSKPPLRVVPAQSLLSVPAVSQPPYRQGQELVLVRRNSYPSDAARKLVGGGFEVRFFRVPGPDASPVPWLVNQDDCDIFLSLVVRTKFSGTTARIGALQSNYWLTQQPNGYFSSGYYLVVIEQAAPPDPVSSVDRWQVFRLARASRAAYFQQGFRIQIDPAPAGGRPADSPAEDVRVKQALNEIAREISTRLNCFRATPIANAPEAAEGAAQLALAACLTERGATSGS